MVEGMAEGGSLSRFTKKVVMDVVLFCECVFLCVSEGGLVTKLPNKRAAL